MKDTISLFGNSFQVNTISGKATDLKIKSVRNNNRLSDLEYKYVNNSTLWLVDNQGNEVPISIRQDLSNFIRTNHELTFLQFGKYYLAVINHTTKRWRYLYPSSPLERMSLLAIIRPLKESQRVRTTKMVVLISLLLSMFLSYKNVGGFSSLIFGGVIGVLVGALWSSAVYIHFYFTGDSYMKKLFGSKIDSIAKRILLEREKN
ncbi:hypothetical protein [Sediminitomix flava]|uniref:Uncharacterized protein n=1 Tax=Sediminitomix flava TaxID=379075 RepID=A0A315ZZJ1_SEDFL|nr:hypothetical protein [Sediminitomix flava]PWJ42787.1 hypothetical protein BC781_102333 [Sediminitomix flava]